MVVTEWTSDSSTHFRSGISTRKGVSSEGGRGRHEGKSSYASVSAFPTVLTFRPFGKSVSQSVQSLSLFFQRLHEHPFSFLSFVLGYQVNWGRSMANWRLLHSIRHRWKRKGGCFCGWDGFLFWWWIRSRKSHHKRVGHHIGLSEGKEIRFRILLLLYQVQIFTRLHMRREIEG